MTTPSGPRSSSRRRTSSGAWPRAGPASFRGTSSRRWGKDAFKSQPVGTGAFRFTEHVPFQRTVTERNADYFRDGLPYVDRIEWIPVQDESARSAQIISGTVDVDPWAPLKLLDSFKAAEGVELVGGATSRYEFVDLNCGRPPFNHVDMRRAMSLATDRQAIVDLALLGEGEPLVGGPIGPSGHPFFTNLDTNAKAPDLDRARALVASAGFGDGVEVQGLAESGSRFSDVLEILQQQWSAVGVNLKINAIEAGAARARRGEGDYDVAISGWGTLVDPHDFTGENFYTDGGFNFGKCGDATLDGLLDRGVAGHGHGDPPRCLPGGGELPPQRGGALCLPVSALRVHGLPEPCTGRQARSGPYQDLARGDLARHVTVPIAGPAAA